MIRFVVCIDVESDDLCDAYGKMSEALHTLQEGVLWESTDEAFQNDGSEIDPEDLQEARMEYFNKRAGTGEEY